MNIWGVARWLALIVAGLFVLGACGGGGGGGSSVSPTPTYSVTYNGNGNTAGSVPVDTISYEQGQVVTVLDNTGVLERTGYLFAGWNTQPDGNGTTYTQAQTFTMGSANVTLYAKWTANPTYTVTYDGNGNTGGTTPSDSTNYEQGQPVTVLGNTGNLVRTGYTFTGWNTQADGQGSDYAATGAATFTMGTANVTLYATWSANPTYTVTYDGNGNTGGTAPVDSASYEWGQTVTVLGNTGNLTKTGYAFAGWNTQADGNGTTYTQAQTFTIDSTNVTLYAKWTANPTFTVTYDSNGNTAGNVPVDSNGYEQGQTVTVLGNSGNLAKTGYAFAGWNTQADGNGTTYTESQTFLMGTVSVTLYAKWELALYTVGGTVSGLSGELVMQNNGADDLTLTTNGTFTFSSSLVSGATYSVSVATQPNGQICDVTGGTGTVNDNPVASIEVWCHASAGGIPVGGYPNWQERAVQVVANAVRQAPQDYIATYTSFTNILLSGTYPAVAPLYWNELLNQAARSHALDMATTPCFQHDSCDGTSWITRITSFYPGALITGENIALGTMTPQATVDLWVCESTNPDLCAADGVNDGHRAILMNSLSREVGNGFVSSYWVLDTTRNTPVAQPPVVSGAHLVINGGLQYWLNYYAASAPSSVRIVIDGSATNMPLSIGTDNSGLYTLSTTLGTGCQSYHFEAIDGQGKGWRYPGVGELRTYGVGGCAEDYLQ